MTNISNIHSAGLALGGGAARGWAHIGVLLALAEHNIKVTHIAGTSIGAFVGAFHATGTLDILHENVLNLDWKQGLGYFASIPSKTGMISGRKIATFLDDHISTQSLEDAAIPLCTVATDLRTGKEITISRGSIIDAVRASIAIPGIFTPLQKDNLLLVDGGLVNPVPVSTLRTMGAKHIIAVDLNGVSNKPDNALLQEENPHLLEIIGASATIVEAELTKNKFATDPPDILIQPELGHVSYLDFARGEEIIQLGYKATMEVFEQKGNFAR